MCEEYWITKDGIKIAVGEMSEDHVRNALRMVIRSARQGRVGYDWEAAFWDDIYRYGVGSDEDED